MANYPQAEQFRQAQAKYDERIFAENNDGSIESYEFFLQNYPESPYRKQAEKMIYSLSVPDNSVEQYAAFARKFKTSYYNNEAWHEVYKLSMKDYSEQSFRKFKSEYPDYPFPEELEADFRLQNYFFLPFVEQNTWGYINESGEEMIKPSFEEASLFHDGLAFVASRGKYGYINKSGKLVIGYQFDDAESFHNSAAVVQVDTLYGLIDKSGGFLIQPSYEELTDVSEDIYMGVKDDLSGYVKRNGDTLTGFVFDVANEFRDGYAIVSNDEKYGLVNTGGGFNIEPLFDDLVFIGKGLLKAMTEEELWGIVNVQGDTVFPFSCDAIGDFSEHRAMIVRNGKCGYINEEGAIIIPVIYRYSSLMITTGRFRNGYAWLKQKVRSNVLDTTGKQLVFRGYEDYGRPSEGFIPVRKNYRWGFADLKGKLKIACKYESVEPFVNNFALIHQKQLTGLIDTSGTLLIEALYDDIFVLEKAIMVRSHSKNGLLTLEGIMLIPCNYDKIEFLSPFIARASNAEGFTYVNLDSGKIIFNSESH
jgi:hypothetical protein